MLTGKEVKKLKKGDTVYGYSCNSYNETLPYTPQTHLIYHITHQYSKKFCTMLYFKDKKKYGSCPIMPEKNVREGAFRIGQSSYCQYVGKEGVDFLWRDEKEMEEFVRENNLKNVKTRIRQTQHKARVKKKQYDEILLDIEILKQIKKTWI